MCEKIDKEPLVSGLIIPKKELGIIYKYKFRAVCPNDLKVKDWYEVFIYSKTMIMAEDIVKYFESFKEKAIFQEDLTIEISEHFECKVKLIGDHLGVMIESQTND